VSDPRTDRAVLTGRQYADGGNLRSRAALYQWQSPQLDFPEWVLSRLPWKGTETVLDLGCGYGAYLSALGARARAVIGTDLSLGMLREATEIRVPLANADVVALPFDSKTFDVALSAHMLYHVPDIAAAVREMRRVLRPGGSAIVATNGSDDKTELMALLHRAADKPAGTFRKTDARFLLDDAVIGLRQCFESVREIHVRTEIHVPMADPVVAYVDSIRTAAEPALGTDWDELLLRMRALVEDEIASSGPFRISTHSGVVIGT
jgi:ubiquinone/menaquinone biosynthesis C-methylase UbiE